MARRKSTLRKRLRKHGLPAAVAGLAALAVGVQISWHLAANVTDAAPIADIAIEHDQPLDLSLALSHRDGRGLLDIDHNGDETVYLSVPSDWVRTEVRHAELAAVTAEPPMFSFTRWTLPSQSGIRFELPQTPTGIMLHHPSPATLKLETTFVDLDTNTVKHDIRLVAGEAIRVW